MTEPQAPRGPSGERQPGGDREKRRRRDRESGARPPPSRRAPHGPAIAAFLLWLGALALLTVGIFALSRRLLPQVWPDLEPAAIFGLSWTLAGLCLWAAPGVWFERSRRWIARRLGAGD